MQRAPDSIKVVYQPGVVYYTITDRGPARVIGADARVFEFQASHEDFRRIAEMLAPLQARGLICATPWASAPLGYIVWRRGGEEVRRQPMQTLCDDPPTDVNAAADSAWNAMREMGRARYVAPAIPAPTTITLQDMYWGNPTATWTVPRDGEGHYVDPQRDVTFHVSAETFDRIREIFRPYESRYFECRRVVTDGPYGFVIWSSREGQEDQRTQWDAGCITGDAADLFSRLDAATAILVQLRDAAHP